MKTDAKYLSGPSGLLIITLYCLAAVVFILFPVTAQAAQPDETAVTAGSEYDYPPFCVVDADGNPNGFSVELLRAALKAMGREVSCRVGPWSEVKGWLEKGQVQALPLVGRTPEREALFDFTFPYMSIYGAIVVRKDTDDIRTLGDLKGRRVAVMKADNAEEFLRREKRGIEIYTTPTFDLALKDLSEGRCDAVVIQRLVALRLISETGLTNLKVINQPVTGFRQDFCFAVKEGDRDTLALLNEGLALVMADGTYRHLHAKWFAALELPTNRRIVVGGDHNYPPYEYLDENGRPAGYNVDLTRAIAQEAGLDVEIRLGPWAEILKGLENGEIDVIQGMFYSPERDLKYDFSPAHEANHYVSVVRKGEGSPPDNFNELTGKSIVLQQGDIIYDLAVKNGLEKQISLVETQEDVLREVAEGHYDCALVVRVSALLLIEENGWQNLALGHSPFHSVDYCYAVLNNQRALLAKFSEGLKILEETGEYQRIYEKWLGVYQDSRLPLAALLMHLALVAIPLLLIIFAGLLWSWSLRRQVGLRTEELRRSVEFQRAIIACSPVALYAVDEDGNVLTWNSSAERIFGWTAEEVIGKPIPIVPDDKQEEFAGFRKMIMEGQNIRGREIIRRKKDGALFEASLSAAPIYDAGNNIIGIMASIEDVTERKRAEEAQRDSEVRYRRLFESAKDGILILEADTGRVIDVNPFLMHLLGYPFEALYGKYLWEIGPFNDIAASKDAFNSLINQGYIRYEDLPLKTSDGQLIDVEFVSNVYLVDNTRVIQCNIRDITARKQAEAERERLMAAVEQAGDMIIITDPEGTIQYVNPAFERVTGYARGEALGRNPNMLKSGRHDQAFYQDLWNTITGGRVWEGRLVNKRKDGTLYNEEATIAPVRDASGRVIHFVAVKHDITEHLKLTSQVQQGQKMEAVGRLAGGVAHDYNNMLSVIIGYAEMAMDKLDPAEPLYTDLGEILKAARRSRDITRQLLAFARKQTVAPVALDLNEAVGSMLKTIRRLIGEDIDLAWGPSAGLWTVKMDPTQVDQILANLCVNARDAIDGVGKVTIETGTITFDQAYCADHPGFVPGDFVLLAVSDDGRGMDRETLENIFEPFFTTKDTEQGTGLGLATVYGIVKQNNGFINVYSEPDQGTTFKIYLPRHTDETVTAKTESPAQVQKGEGEIILVVEDEAAIMKLAKIMLERQGYAVLTAATPGEALSLAEEHGGEIHLLITDVIMPEMNGRDLSEKLRSLYPGLKCLFMSGYTANVIAHHGVLDEGVNFIQKPFSIKDLAAKVREALDKK